MNIESQLHSVKPLILQVFCTILKGTIIRFRTHDLPGETNQGQSRSKQFEYLQEHTHLYIIFLIYNKIIKCDNYSIYSTTQGRIKRSFLVAVPKQKKKKSKRTQTRRGKDPYIITLDMIYCPINTSPPHL